MPLIKLKQKKGTYHWQGRGYPAEKILEVSNQEAYYLIHNAKVAEEVSAEDRDIEETSVEHEKEKLFREKNLIKIAMVRLGGLGDSLLLACHAKAVKRRYPNSEISLYIRDKCEILNEMPQVDRVVICGNVVWWDLVSELRQKDNYDIIFDNRYVTKVFFRRDEILKPEFLEEKKEYERCFSTYSDTYNKFINSCVTLPKYNVSTFELFYKSTGLEGGEDDISIPLSKGYYKFAMLLDKQKYVTVHNGSDIARQTKCYPTKHWNEVVAGLKKQGYEVIQLGKEYEEPIEGTKNLCGVTSLFETSALIDNADFHIDAEGGLVHIARAVRTRSIVIFGPTPVVCFGYSCNINIEPDIRCKGCWWTTDYWWRDCPKGHQSPPPCMADTLPKQVLDAVKTIAKLPKMEKAKDELVYDPTDINEQFAMQLELTEGHYKSEKHQWERIYTMMDEVKGPKVLEVGAGDGYCVHVLKKRGFEVTATEISKIRIQRMKDDGIDAIEADLNHLPFDDETFDTVICGEVLEHIPSMAQGLKELERVCKPDGKIVFSLPISPRYDPIKMHLWSIRMKPIMYQDKPDLAVFTIRKINRDV